MERKPIIIVQGGQYGSESKGLVAAKLVNHKRVDIAIRTGTINAGHTVYYGGHPYRMQQLPVAWVNPYCHMVLGPGAYIHPPTLEREIKMVMSATRETKSQLLSRIWIDKRCGIHLDSHTDRAKPSGRHYAMGATGKGCSEAVIDKIKNRGLMGADFRSFSEWLSVNPRWADQFLMEALQIGDTVDMVNSLYDRGRQLLIEGTQGTFLDLHLGPYPYTTHKQTQAASWMAEAGLSCTLPTDLWLVMRTMPIRVAGNSGPLPNETSWADLIRSWMLQFHEPFPSWMPSPDAIDWLNKTTLAVLRQYYPEAPRADPGLWSAYERARYRVAASEAHAEVFALARGGDVIDELSVIERTTVTQKVRRIAHWDWETAEQSVMLNRPHHIALTFMNYLYPHMWGTTQMPLFGGDGFANHVQERLGVPVSLLSYGPLEENTFLYDEVQHAG